MGEEALRAVAEFMYEMAIRLAMKKAQERETEENKV